MLQMKDFTCIFHGVSREIHQTGSVPQCSKLLASSLFFAVFPMKVTQTAEY